MHVECGRCNAQGAQAYQVRWGVKFLLLMYMFERPQNGARGWPFLLVVNSKWGPPLEAQELVCVSLGTPDG